MPGNIGRPEMRRYAYTLDCGSRDSKRVLWFDVEEHIRNGVFHPYIEGRALVNREI